MVESNIRPLQQQDIEILGDKYFPWSTREETIAKWTRYLDEQQKAARVACIIEHEGKLAGYGNLLPYSEYPNFRNKNIPEINDVWVFEESRKQGLATILIDHLEQLAKDHGYTEVGIGVGLYRDYGPAQRLYFRLGYKPNGEGITYKHNTVIPGEQYPVDDDLILWLTKHLP